VDTVPMCDMTPALQLQLAAELTKATMGIAPEPRYHYHNISVAEKS
jgi:hypothetical protein